MALGRHYFGPTTLDSASDPDDTTLFAAPSSNAGKPERSYIKQLVVNVTTAVASTVIHIEDGVGGAVLATFDSTVASVKDPIRFEDDEEGIRCSENTLLNATIVGDTGVVATVQGVIDVRGG